MDGFFNPEGTAIFGISPNPKNLARTILRNLNFHNYQGKVVGIGSRETSTLGVKIYKSITDVKERIDLAVIVTPAPTIIPILQECRQSGINRAVIMTAGFKELKGNDDQLSRDLTKAAEEMDVRFIGPNCQGVINTHIGLCLPFGIFPPGKLKKGDISIITQSGTICWLDSFYLSHEISGVNKVVSIGNKMNVNEVDLLAYLIDDETTRIIVLHLESTERGRELFEIIARSPKPVILFKTQISSESHAVAYSHTAALADDDRIVEGVSLQTGAMRATSFREMIDMAKALSLPPIKGNRLGIVSASGGVGIMAADTCKREGMQLASLADECLNKIREIPKAKVINITNPVDTGNIYDSDGNFKAMKMIMKLDEVDGGVLSQFHPQTGDYFEKHPIKKIVNEVAELSRNVNKPIAMHFLCDPLTKEEMKTEVEFPLFDSIEDAVCGLKYLYKFEALRQKAERWDELRGTDGRSPFQFKQQVSPDLEGFRLLSHYEITCEPLVFAKGHNEIISKAEKMGYPVVLKALSPDFTHKQAHGAVALDIADKQALQTAIHQMENTIIDSGARIDTFLLQKMVPSGPELFLGGKQDSHYGPVVLFGPGGTDVEKQENLLCYLAPLSQGMAEDMLNSVDEDFIKSNSCYTLLRNHLVRFSQILTDNPHIVEIDLNPVRLIPQTGDVKVLDVRVKLDS
ncbi:MAG: acetate--CoA ligase family protein [Proteobacteria bacterium]|nr:acetate--CoA ligase family protein [Pseudomonadota bacterium]